jgi:hypothetical protein
MGNTLRDYENLWAESANLDAQAARRTADIEKLNADIAELGAKVHALEAERSELERASQAAINRAVGMVVAARGATTVRAIVEGPVK